MAQVRRGVSAFQQSNSATFQEAPECRANGAPPTHAPSSETISPGSSTVLYLTVAPMKCETTNTSFAPLRRNGATSYSSTWITGLRNEAGPAFTKRPFT